MITPPWFTDSAEYLGFNAYAMHTSLLDDTAKYLARKFSSFDEITDEDIQEACYECNLNYNEVSNSEFEYLFNEIKKRI